MSLSKELLPPCAYRECGKVWRRQDTEQYVYHPLIGGVACRSHPDIMRKYELLLANADAEFYGARDLPAGETT